jgi:serine/threonine protein kinase
VSDPTQVKHYEILSRLGAGGMGVVYRAKDTRLGRTVALKMLSGEFALDAERSQRFEREARIVSSMSHPGIATLFDFDTEKGSAFLTMELIEGPTLREVLEPGPMAVDKLLDCGAQVADAIAAAHEHGVVHRDLKPENIMVTGSGFYKVLDFGVARIDEPDTQDKEERANTQTPTRWLTRRGMLMGTVAYMSPEQVQGENADARSDIFALGSVLYECATGRSAFARATEVATLHAIAYEDPEDIRRLRPEIPHGLALVIAKCLAKKPGDRYASSAQLAADLELLKRETHSGSRTSTPSANRLGTARRGGRSALPRPLCWSCSDGGCRGARLPGWCPKPPHRRCKSQSRRLRRSAPSRASSWRSSKTTAATPAPLGSRAACRKC